MLYIIGTPIGNIKDISLRAVETIFSLHYLLTEDTRTTGIFLMNLKKLFTQYKNAPNPKLISYYQEIEMEKLPLIIKLLQEGKKVGLISQAGMPLISDPGYLLIKTLIKKNLKFTVIPGPTALTTALIHSGFKGKNFLFLGFYPKKTSRIKKINKELKKIVHSLDYITIIFYESPKRVTKTTKALKENFPEGKIVIARELTKRYEEIIRDPDNTIPQKGEFVILMNFNKDREENN